MDSNLLGALELFGFTQIKHPNRHRFVFNEGYNYGLPFSWDCHFKSIPMKIHINEAEQSYHDSTFYVTGSPNEKIICFERKRLSDLIKHIIDYRKEYFKTYFSYNVQRVIKEYNIIPIKPLDLDEDKIEIYSTCREYEVSQWGGVDKDNHYTTYIDYDYFVVYDKYILIDDYIRSVIQKPWRKEVNYYKDYKSTLDTASDKYWIEKADNVLLDLFKTAYSGYSHKQYIISLNK